MKIAPDLPLDGSPSSLNDVPTESTDGSGLTTNEPSTDPEIEEALRTAGLLSDSPPNSPHQEAKGLNDEDDLLKENREGLDNTFDMDSHLELDIYGENHPTVASVVVRLADLYNKVGKLRESKSYYENALRFYGKPNPGIPSEEIASGLIDTSAIFEPMNELEQALKLLQKALKIYGNALG
ncbi:hypothetical protein VitviT2T_030337 [Vitis vinifera]|uniref:Uncharacterized protein n=1 Tax=Vitis vinifera TaxID=29760 RepID=A0ABY9E1Z2_VITVI|nr:hypothetical protein VitviT2T_030337 [Vitis vinifera]